MKLEFWSFFFGEFWLLVLVNKLFGLLDLCEKNNTFELIIQFYKLSLIWFLKVDALYLLEYEESILILFDGLINRITSVAVNLIL